MGWSAKEIPSQAGRTWIVTGANSGLGLVTARELARAGATVVMGCRNEEKGKAALEDVASVADARPALLKLDLASLDSVRDFAASVSEHVETLDGLVLNAGVMAPPREETADGFELQLGTNHLGHFALAGLLAHALTEAPEGRVVTVSSVAHRMGRMDWDDLQGERSYSRWRRYGQSKLANLLFAFELQRRSDAGNWDIRSVAAHPGYSSTHLQTSGPGLGGGLIGMANVVFGKVGNVLIAQSDESGALPSLYAATVDGVPGGAFIGPSGPGEMRGSPRIVSSTRASRSEEDAERLWQVSEELTGVRFP